MIADVPALIAKYKDWIRKTGNADELYKWEATRHFQETWNIDAEDFALMLKKALSKSSNLLYPNSWQYIMLAARHYPEETRAMFRTLLDEGRDLSSRLKEFATGAAGLTSVIQEKTGKRLQPHQDERTMALYLAMAYPERHYLYKYSYYLKTCDMLGEKTAEAGEKYLHFLIIAEKLKRDYLLRDQELLDLHHATLNPSCYRGDDSNLILQNLLWVGLQRLADEKPIPIDSGTSWWIYAPGQGAKYWEDYADEGVMGLGWSVLGDLSAYESQEAIAERLRIIDRKPDASFKNNSLACWQFANDIREGDVVVAKRESNEYVGLGIVTSGYRYEAARGDQPNIRSVNWVRRGSWHDPRDSIVLKTLTNVTQYSDYVAMLRELILESKASNPQAVARGMDQPRNYILYGPPGTGKTWSTVEIALALIEGRSVDVLSGYSREELRRRYADASKDGLVEFLTFHQSYSYEEFVEGIRPRTVAGAISYEVESGAFKHMCDRARSRSTTNHVLVIDEINRGNVARIFGELITLIEDDKREGATEATICRLPYSGEQFSVPSNLFLVGTMNTADRSVEALDTALRRRFSFKEIMPRPQLLSDSEYAIPDLDLQALLETINRRLERLLDRDHQIGHAYFMGLAVALDPLEALRSVFRDRVLPLLKEYFYSDPAKIGLVLGKRFVEQVDTTSPFADFDADIAERYSAKREYRFSEAGSWTLEHFTAIYENQTN